MVRPERRVVLAGGSPVRVRQIPIPTHLKQEVEQGVRRFTEIQTLLKQISYVNQDLLEERKKR